MSNVTQVGDILEEYAARGVFQGFSREEISRQRGLYRVQWHRKQLFEITYDGAKKSLRIACVLPQVPAKSAMYREFKRWLKARTDDALPDHRRCDSQKITLKTYNRSGDIALTLQMLDEDLEYSVRKLVSLVNEIYLDFLSSGLYFDWLIETFDLDPDNPY
ncbi:MAG: hypothetical protein IMF06_16205 [Proteobacteria bacterium]|nr:hypothetical protein [Pseudomonadota bacterium]